LNSRPARNRAPTWKYRISTNPIQKKSQAKNGTRNCIIQSVATAFCIFSPTDGSSA